MHKLRQNLYEIWTANRRLVRFVQVRMRRLLLLLALSLALPIQAQTADGWRADLATMASEMEQVHRNLYHSVSREQFAAMVTALSERIPTLTRHEIIVEMMRIAAAVGDGHTNINPARDPKIGFRELPVAFYFFENGLFIPRRASVACRSRRSPRSPHRRRLGG